MSVDTKLSLRPEIFISTESGKYNYYKHPVFWYFVGEDRTNNKILIANPFLKNNTKYYYRVRSYDDYCQITNSSEYSFTTLSPSQDHILGAKISDLKVNHSINSRYLINGTANVTVTKYTRIGNNSISEPIEGADVYAVWEGLWPYKSYPESVYGITDLNGNVTFDFKHVPYVLPWIKLTVYDVIVPGYTFQDYWISKSTSIDPGIMITTYSPVDILVRDPDGLIISKEINEIQNASYHEINIEDNIDTVDAIDILEKKIGKYSINVIPDPDALPTETYTLVVSEGDTSITLAEKVQINDIPNRPYIVMSTNLGIMIPIESLTAIIKIKPETLNLASKGVFTAFIQLPNGYDVEDIDINTIVCEGAFVLTGTVEGDMLVAKFNRQDLENVPIGDEVSLKIKGKLSDGTPFE
jgi:hypothetical protein